MSRSLEQYALPASLLTFLLLVEQLTPPLPLYFAAASSMALGTACAAALITLVSWVSAALSPGTGLHRTLDFLVKPAWVTAVVVAAVLLHAVVADQRESIDMTRLAASLVPLALLVAGGMILGAALCASPDAQADSSVRVSFWVLCAVMLFAVLGIQPMRAAYVKPMFPFGETSHFALAFGPVWIYRCVRAERSRSLWWVLGGFGLALVLQSLSLVVVCFLAAAACRRLLIVTCMALVVVLIGLPLQLQYFSTRLDFTGNVVNLSNLVYLQGWGQMAQSLVDTSGWGLGFQQMGLHPNDSSIATLIRQIASGVDLNAYDGSFVLAKLVSEFGAFGIALSILYVVGAVRCMSVLRSGPSIGAATFARCIVVGYAVDMFVRGTGYFVQSTLLFVAASAALMSGRTSPLIRLVRHPNYDPQ